MKKKEHDPALFAFINDLSEQKKDLLSLGVYQEEEFQKNSYQIQRGLSQHLDCIMYVDEINVMPWLPARMRHDYLLAAVPARRRPAMTWAKKAEADEELKAIAVWFDINQRRAEGIRELLSDEQVSTIVKKVRVFNER